MKEKYVPKAKHGPCESMENGLRTLLWALAGIAKNPDGAKAKRRRKRRRSERRRMKKLEIHMVAK